jgi:hypothetical protein
VAGHIRTRAEAAPKSRTRSCRRTRVDFVAVSSLDRYHTRNTMEAFTESMHTLCLDYDKSKVPAGGAEVVGQCASPLPGLGRMTAEPAGRKFHEKCMRVRGLITGTLAVS